MLIDNEAEGGENLLQHLELRESLKDKFPLSFLVKSANLRVSDTIGQGWL